jgi:hypothetical protein
MQWFQYRPGSVTEARRLTHRAAPVDDDGLLRSWCHQIFPALLVEETSNPALEPQPGIAAPCAPCVGCLLLVLAASPSASDKWEKTVPTVDNHRALAVLLRKANWLLDDAAWDLPAGRLSVEDLQQLAETLDELTALIRDQVQRSIVVDELPSTTSVD